MIIQALGATAYRLSIEWARVEPKRGKWDDAALEGYRQRLLALKGFAAHDDRWVGMDLDRPAIDFPGLAAALGVPAERVERTADVAPALARALASGGPYLLDARVDPSFK